MSFFKGVERYVSAIFKLGRTARLAKAASHGIGVIEPRLDALQDEIDRLERRIEDLATGGAEGALPETLDRRLAILESRQGEIGARQDGFASRLGELRGRVKLALDTLERLDRTEERLTAIEQARGMGQEAEQHLRERCDAISAGLDRLAPLAPRLAGLAVEQAGMARAYTDLSRRLDLVRFGQPPAPATPPGPPPERREGLDALLDAFYSRLEDRYRGTRADIKDRLRVYLPDVRAAVEATGRPVLDLGCGRGEWIELLSEAGIAARGVDLNPLQIAEASPGLDLVEGDAMQALAEAADGTLGAVTAHHLVEHLPFDTVVWMAREALRALAPGGVLIVETPNPRNLIVGATTFNIDPTHRRPLPAEVLTTLFDTVGFHPVEARPLHPSETLEAFAGAGRLDGHVAELLFGAQDLAVLGTRPGAGG